MLLLQLKLVKAYILRAKNTKGGKYKMIPDKILSIIVCPACKGKFDYSEGLRCRECGAKYDIVNGVPYLLDVKAEGGHRDLNRTFEFKSGIRNSHIFKTLKYIFGADFVPYDPLNKFNDLFLGKDYRKRLVLNMGSGSTRHAESMVNIDIEHLPNVDIVADGSCLPFSSCVFDAVISEAVIEHVRDLGCFMKELKRVLKKNGAVFVVAPFVHHFHAYPNDFQRYSLEGLKVIFEDFDEVESGVYRGPSVALVNFLSEYAASLFCSRPQARILLKSIFTLFLFPIKFLDIFLNKRPDAFVLAHCVYYIGMKR